MQKGRVIKILSDRFAVDTGNSVVFVKSRKKVKRDVLPLPGDIVVLDDSGGEYVLSSILPRTCRMVRPPIANVEQIVITVAPIPETEFSNVDKLIINARHVGIRTVICVNKTDIVPDGYHEEIKAQYGSVVDDLIEVCAARGDTDKLIGVLQGRFTCFAGQSAVGKTSIINAVCGINREVGGVSEKTQKGKNTTTDVEIIPLGDNTFVADTPGFAALDINDILPSDLHLYYGEYVELADNCRYRMCSHTIEPDCAVKKAVEDGGLNASRYERYLSIMDELKKQNTHRRSWRYANEKK